ncbi:MinD/ParA family protein [Priestia megaterium]|nr:MinD/ParA family protein [Priestia megaterium]
MNDQAEILRKQVGALNEGDHAHEAKALAVLSGKGGVGKSNFSLNFSLALQKKGYRVLLFDMDIGMGNIDILMGMTATYTIVDLFEASLSVQQIIKKGPEGLSYIAGGSGISSIFELSNHHLTYLIEQLSSLASDYDYIIFDMGAGMTENVLTFLKSMNDIIVITTPEPTSITDAYAAVKFMSLYDINAPFHIVINKALSKKEGLLTYNRFEKAVQQFLHRSVYLLGAIPNDQSVIRAVNSQTPFFLYDVKSKASEELREIVKTYTSVNDQQKNWQVEKQTSFVKKLKKFFLER